MPALTSGLPFLATLIELAVSTSQATDGWLIAVRLPRV
jgi:hypothetical protein